jgi:hypothetical protein
VEARIHKSTSGNDWKELYKAAIFEDDSVKLGARIAEAERALADRAAELCSSNETSAREQQAMENAAYFLRLLRKTNATLNPSYEPPSPPQISSQQLCGWCEPMFFFELRKFYMPHLETCLFGIKKLNVLAW